MLGISRRGAVCLAAVAALMASATGCTSFRDYIHNGFKVGPNYCKPAAPVAEHWIDAPDVNSTRGEDLSKWWATIEDPVLKGPDPVLNHLIQTAYRQNLTLREAGMRVLQARATLAIAKGNFFPQSQTAFGNYTRSGGTGVAFADNWDFGFGLQWELDFWGRFRRAILAADDQLDASVEGYDFALVTLLGDVAANYVQVRLDQEQIRLTQENVALQRNIVEYLQARSAKGYGPDVDLNKYQGESVLAQTEAGIPAFEIDLRQANDQLCILLGIPSVDLREAIPVWKAVDERKAVELERVRSQLQQLLTQEGQVTAEDLHRMTSVVRPIYIPSVPHPKDVAIGIPADLLRNRPDVRQAERLAAAQGEQIGIAQSDLYPAFTLSGQLGYSARTFQALFTPEAFNGSFSPGFQWNVLNYGRIVNNVRFQDAKFQELVLAYQNSVLVANQEVEDGLVTFARSDQRRELLGASVRASLGAVRYVSLQKAKGQIDVNRYSTIAQNLVQQEVSWAQAYAQIVQGLITVYRSLGGGWEIRLSEETPEPPTLDALPSTPPDQRALPKTAKDKEAEEVPSPAPNAPREIAEPMAAPQPIPDVPSAEKPAEKPAEPEAKP